ncbi:methyltransferase [Roseovarius sp. TE539]|uniref:tRNA1(Val) (adenine(37)-N6)-methyltransferase n=1 Tax=Roseovarius sp. TE539 TaxID=2249812 RepID=UPI000DDD66E1|nr:methyltransferase [Roseovarius sp. TE539]RBI77048.1 methyltransferase [Roseovarius sp. TE539]
MNDGPARLSVDEFLGGRISLSQPRKGYRAGIDPVLLAAAVPARTGQTVLDLGCGAGAAALCLAARVPGLDLAGLELQPFYADLARRNAKRNDIAMEVVTGDLAEMPQVLKQRRFDHVVANPPYLDRAAGTTAHDAGRESALAGPTPLHDWMCAAARRTLPGGHVSVIQRAERLPDLMAAVSAAGLGSFEILPVLARRGRAARLVLLRTRKGGRAAPRLLDAWVLHDGETHDGDRDDYTAQTTAILRDGAALHF